MPSAGASNPGSTAGGAAMKKKAAAKWEALFVPSDAGQVAYKAHYDSRSKLWLPAFEMDLWEGESNGDFVQRRCKRVCKLRDQAEDDAAAERENEEREQMEYEERQREKEERGRQQQANAAAARRARELERRVQQERHVWDLSIRAKESQLLRAIGGNGSSSPPGAALFRRGAHGSSRARHTPASP